MEELNVDEKVDHANRLRLSQKYCGIYMCNTSDSNEIVQFDNHLVVVDLEWSVDRLGTAQIRRGRFLFVICELISPFHDAAIAEAGEGRRSICKAYIVLQMRTSCPNSPSDSPS